MGAEIPLPRRALSVTDYHRMGEVGLFAPEERVELIQGDLVAMAPIGGPHLRLVNVLAQLLSMQVGRTAVVSVQNPLYARHGIPEAWLFDVAGARATIYRDPSPEGYRTELSPARDAIISPQLRADVAISLAEVWLASTD